MMLNPVEMLLVGGAFEHAKQRDFKVPFDVRSNADHAACQVLVAGATKLGYRWRPGLLRMDWPTPDFYQCMATLTLFRGTQS